MQISTSDNLDEIYHRTEINGFKTIRSRNQVPKKVDSYTKCYSCNLVCDISDCCHNFLRTQRNYFISSENCDNESNYPQIARNETISEINDNQSTVGSDEVSLESEKGSNNVFTDRESPDEEKDYSELELSESRDIVEDEKVPVTAFSSSTKPISLGTGISNGKRPDQTTKFPAI